MRKVAEAIAYGNATDQVKAALYARVRAKVEQECGEATPNSCLYWSMFLLDELFRMGIYAVLQAGSAFWPRVSKETYDTDETCTSHFGYEWNPDELLNAVAKASGMLPEIHVWVGLVVTQEVLDFTTGFWPDNCKQFLRVEWEGVIPPKFFWGRYNDLPELVRYEPCREASIYAAGLIDMLRSNGVV